MPRHTYADIDHEVVQQFIDNMVDCYGSYYDLAVALRSSAGRLLAIRCGDKRITAELWRRLDDLALLNAERETIYW